MSCSDCHKVNPIPYCFTYLIITDYEAGATDNYLLYIYDYANSRTTVTEVTAAATTDPLPEKAEGIIQTDFRFQPNHTYNITLKQDGIDQNFTIGATTVCCVDVHVIDDNYSHEIITLSDDGCTVE